MFCGLVCGLREVFIAQCERGGVNSKVQVPLEPRTEATTAKHAKRSTWEQVEGSPLPLGVTWIEDEEAFNFAVHAEHAESVTLLLYSDWDLVNPLLAYRFDFLR